MGNQTDVKHIVITDRTLIIHYTRVIVTEELHWDVYVFTLIQLWRHIVYRVIMEHVFHVTRGNVPESDITKGYQIQELVYKRESLSKWLLNTHECQMLIYVLSTDWSLIIVTSYQMLCPIASCMFYLLWQYVLQLFYSPCIL